MSVFIETVVTAAPLVLATVAVLYMLWDQLRWRQAEHELNDQLHRVIRFADVQTIRAQEAYQFARKTAVTFVEEEVEDEVEEETEEEVEDSEEADSDNHLADRTGRPIAHGEPPARRVRRTDVACHYCGQPRDPLVACPHCGGPVK